MDVSWKAGGFIANQANTGAARTRNMTSSESEEQRPKKRSRASANADDAAGKKARGRPRVDTTDATAADRRRTQIRLAQRAYRQRKETTISSLKRQNDRLQGFIEQMNQSFLHFNESALKSGLLQLNPSLAQELKNVTNTFVALAKTAAEGSNEGEDEATEDTVDPPSEFPHSSASMRQPTQSTQPEMAEAVSEPIHTNIGWGYSLGVHAPAPDGHHQDNVLQHRSYFSHLSRSPHKAIRDSSLVRRRQVTVGEVIDQSGSANQTDSSSQQLPFGLNDTLPREHNPYAFGLQDPQIYPLTISSPRATPPHNRLPSPPLLPSLSESPSLSTKTLRTPWTYSYDESTFARRLNRASLEAGFRLLNNTNFNQRALGHVFKLSLPYMTLEQLRERFRMLLSRGINEDLDCWETPFIHLGGAGTHYPRKDAKGNLIPIPNSWTIRSIGPICASMMRAENSKDPSQSHDLNLDLTGFEGEWFDSHDVQGYLEAYKGCFIDPKGSFAEVMIEEEEVVSIDPPHNSFPFHAEKEHSSSNPSGLHNTANLYQHNTTPGLSTGLPSANTLSQQSMPGNSSSINAMFAQPGAPFGLDMPPNPAYPTDFSRFASASGPSSVVYEQPLGLDLAPIYDSNFNAHFNATAFSSGVDMSQLGLDLMGGEMDHLPVVRQKRRRPALVDVTKLVDEIIKRCVCLGRAPGFRRTDVDNAFRESLVSVC